MEYTDSEPQKSDLPGSVDSGKLSSVGQTIRWSDVRITDPDDDQEHLEKEEDVVKNSTKLLDISQQSIESNVSTVSSVTTEILENLYVQDEDQFFNKFNLMMKYGRSAL